MARASEATSRCVIGLDLGTSGCKACVVNARGRIVGEGRCGYPTHAPATLWAEQDPRQWVAAVRKATAAAMSAGGVRPGRVEAIALTSAAHIGVLVDEAMRPTRRAILWNDQRSVQDVERLEKQAGALILGATQQAVSTSWTLAHLAWVRRCDLSAWKRTRRVMVSKDYLGWWLTGEVMTDPASAVSTQLWDARAERWSEALCGLVDLRTDALPAVGPATAILGALTAKSARALGLRPGTPVVNGTLDSATELLAAGVCATGEGMIRLATAGGVQVVVAKPRPHRRRITYPHVFEPRWYCQAGTNTCAAAVAWAVGLWGAGGRDPWARWDAEAAAIAAGSDGLLFHPYLAGERAPYWRADLRASFTGLTQRHGRGHLARAVYEGTAMSIRDAMSVLSDQPLGDGPLALSGGGAGSAVWVQIVADVMGRDLRVVEGCDSAFGAAMLGMAAVKLGDGLKQMADKRRGMGRRVKPGRRRVAIYEAVFGKYRAGVGKVKGS